MRDDAIDLHVPGLAELHARRSLRWSAHPPDVLVATIAEMDYPLAAPVAAALRAAIDRSDLGYTPPAPPRLREAFAGFAARRLGWRVDPEQVSLAPDVMAAVIELCRALAAPGGAVGVATPAYPPFLTELEEAGVRLRTLPLRDDGMLDHAALHGLSVLVLVNPHNPTGRVAPRAELAGLAEACAGRGIWVLADEIHAPLAPPGAVPAWLEVSDAARERGIALTSASKAFNVAGLKAALVVTASAAARDVVARLPDLAERAGLLGVLAAEAAFADGDAWLDAVLARIAANRTVLAEALAAELPAVRWTPPDATYLAWLDCRALGLGDDPAARFLERGRVALSHGPAYGPPGAGFTRMTLGTSPDMVREAVRRMAASVRPSGPSSPAGRSRRSS